MGGSIGSVSRGGSISIDDSDDDDDDIDPVTGLPIGQEAPMESLSEIETAAGDDLQTSATDTTSGGANDTSGISQSTAASDVSDALKDSVNSTRDSIEAQNYVSSGIATDPMLAVYAFEQQFDGQAAAASQVKPKDDV